VAKTTREIISLSYHQLCTC